MSLGNSRSFRQTISSYPILENYPQRIHYSPIPESNINVDQRMDYFLTSTLYNHNQPISPSQSKFLSESRYKPSFDQNSLIKLRPSYVEQRPSISFGQKLPEIPEIEVLNEVEKKKEKEKKSEIKKSKMCQYLGWIIGALLLLAFLVFLILFIICKVHENQHFEASNPPQPFQAVNTIFTENDQPCPRKPYCSNQNALQDSIEPIDVYTKQPVKVSSFNGFYQPFLSQDITEKEIFYKMDHTNYSYLHLRKKSE